MKQELKNKWIEALRSGKYHQGHDSLRKNDGETAKFCCLGVLCDIVDPDGWVEDGELFWKDADASAILNEHQCEEMGLPTDMMILLWHLNDGQALYPEAFSRVYPEHAKIVDIDHEHSFAEIADYIEREAPVDD